MSSPIVVWNPPVAQGIERGTIAIAPLSGAAPLIAPLTEALVAAKPQNGVDVIDPQTLLKRSEIQTVAYNEGQASDLLALSAARRQGAKILMWGEVLSKPEAPSQNVTKPLIADGRLSIAWRLMDVPTGETLTTHTVSVNAAEAIRTYPDLVAYQTDELGILNAAASRASWRLVEPYVQSEKAVLVLPWVSRGASGIRMGNAYARQGRWAEAQAAWEAVLEKHPQSHQAQHNLALAAVARQDFEDARVRILQAMKEGGDSNYQETFGWIEARRRRYHAAFNLPDPEDGWPLGRL